MRKESGFTLIELLVVVAIIGIISVVAIPNLLNAIDRTRQTQSVERVAKLGEYIEIYITDHPKIGCPKTGVDVNALQQEIAAAEINMNETIIYDGWNEELVVWLDPQIAGRNYTITSYGSDEAEGPAPAEPGKVTLFTEDIIWINGAFVQQPIGLQRSGQE